MLTREAISLIPKGTNMHLEILVEELLKAKGYFKSGFRKTEVAQTISRHMEPLRNRSKSFQVFCEAISEIINQN